MADRPFPLRSMTGFARADGAGGGHRWTWELRSVNGKGLDVRFRLPPGFDEIEAAARGALAAALARGNIQAGLTLQREGPSGKLRVNQELLAEILAIARQVGAEIDAAPPTIDGLLGIRGVLEAGEETLGDSERAGVVAGMLGTLGLAVRELVEVRSREGAVLSGVLHARLNEIERLAASAEACPARKPEAIRARLAEQIAALLGAAPALEPERLHQEAVLLATRADIREEIDRLNAHVAAARALLAAGSPAGRQLDFLAQEFNRETNTLCSKANDRELTAIGLNLKAVVDQLREQIQNVE